MQRVSLAILLVIALLIGFAARPVVFQTSWPRDRSNDASAHATAYSFYDALDNALRGGPIEPLAAALSSIFIDHTLDTGESRSAPAFLDQVRAMSTASPPVRLTMQAVDSAGGNLVVGIRLAQEGVFEVGELTVEQPDPTVHLEVLRVHQGKIVDRWAPEFRWLETSDSDDAPVSFSSFSGIVATLMRVELSSTSEHGWRGEGIGMVMVESGSVMLQVSSGSEADAPVILEPGSFAPIASGVRARLRSADGNPVSVVIYSAVRTEASDLSLAMRAQDVAKQGGTLSVLWRGPLYWSQSATLHRPARIVLPIGGEVELTPPTEANVMVGITAGAIEIAVSGGKVEALGENGWPLDLGSFAQIDAGHAALIGGEGTIFLRNISDVPVTLVLVSIEKASVSVE